MSARRDVSSDRPLRVAHIIFRLDVGGMENGLVNLINGLPRHAFTHSIICLTFATEFRNRIQTDNVEILELHKPEGNSLKTYRAVYRALRRIRPDIVHTRNLGTVDLAPIAFLAGCPIRVHGEHGWDAADLGGVSTKYRIIRRISDLFIKKYVAVSMDISRWLRSVIGVDEAKIEQIYNGVDTNRFVPSGSKPKPGDRRVVFGTVGRQDAIKGLDVLIDAVSSLKAARPGLERSIRVVMAGDGPEHARCRSMIDSAGLAEIVELPGSVDDVPGLLQSFDFFVQPSHNEGISNTVLEAMSVGLPVIATEVGGNPELIRNGVEGWLIGRGDSRALGERIGRYLDDVDLRIMHGRAARERAVNTFAIDRMIANYGSLYSGIVGYDDLAAEV